MTLDEWINETFKIADKCVMLTFCFLTLTLLLPFSIPALFIVLYKRRRNGKD